MNSANHAPPNAPDGNPAAEADIAASLGDLAHDSSDYVRAWSTLLASETRLAAVSVIRLLLAALVVPAVVLAICMAFDALVATMLERWLRDWASSIAIVLLLDVAGLTVLLFAMRRWWHNLSLPRSRDALARLIGRFA